MKKISLSLFSFQHEYDDFKALEKAKDAGADAVDFSLAGECYQNPDSIYSRTDEEIVKYYKTVKAKADELGIEIAQTHGREAGFKNIQKEDDVLIENARRDCLATSVLGAKICVIHTATTILLGPEAPAELMYELNKEMFCRILPFAKEYGIIVATETFGDAVLYDCCDFFGDIAAFIKAYNDVCEVDNNADFFKICMDTGHTNKAVRFGNPTPAETIKILGKNICCLHLHDNDGMLDQHKVPLSGTIDWDEVINALDEVGYNGYYNLEVSLNCFGTEIKEKTAKFAVDVMRNLLSK